ncbi:hypothetical protein, partial [Muriicola sp. Z0-33]|uniref:hypothetical protein n=1 Tax=Muriicola sp. Z0-33 TaxID=2816957 RepID=UPI002A04D649|nr:hypothetical protein [Muriicola sp. Z0-33]
MKLKLLLTLAGLCLCTSLSSQIKIGDNPQNLDATSVLELESNDRVLVITRISEAQMNSLAPLAGAMVYNNDAQCVFYFDGASWINLCDSLQLNFTTDPIVNTASTIVITENGDVVNFEVGEISSENILDFSINSNDIQNNSITADKLASDSVGSEELQDNTVTDAEIDYNLVTLSDFLNDAGFITAANIVSGDANNAITDNGGAFYDDSQIISDVAANTAAIAADNDDDQTNELQILSLNADQLTITGGNTVTIPTADGSDTNIQGGTNINVTGIGTAGNPYIINNTFTEVDGSISNELQDLQFNPGTNILTLTNPATPGNQVDLSALAGGGGSTELADQITIVGTGALGDEFEVGDGSIGSIKIIDGTIMPVDLANNSVETAKILDANVTPVKIAPSATNGQVLTTVANNVVWANLPPSSGNDDQNLTGATLSPANILQIDIENGNSTSVDLSALAAGGTDDQTAAEVSFAPTGNTISTDVQAAIEELQTEIDGISAGGAANPNDELNTNFAVNAGNLEITDAGGTLTVPLTSIDTDDQDASEVTYDNTTSGLTAADTQAAIDEIAATAGGNPADELNTTFAVNAG